MEAIKKEIRDWSRYALEVPNPDFNNLPACPYAQAAWQEDKVEIIFKDSMSYGILSDTLKNWNEDKDLVIIVDTDFIKIEERFHKYHDIINKRISENFYKDKDLWVMGFHPYQDANELIDDGTFEGTTDTEYALIFVQRLSKLQEASNKLVSRGYYERYFETYDVSGMYKIRKEYYRRLQCADQRRQAQLREK